MGQSEAEKMGEILSLYRLLRKKGTVKGGNYFKDHGLYFEGALQGGPGLSAWERTERD